MINGALLQDKIEGSALIASMERASTRRELIDAANGIQYLTDWPTRDRAERAFKKRYEELKHHN